jgi:gliding motility-associated lipoprotein GldJ
MALPDTTVWRKELAYNEPYLEYYFSHAGYNNYPVVGVNWEQAMDYCVWRTDRVNEKILIDEGVIEPISYGSIRTNDNPEDIARNQVFSTDKYLMSPEYLPTPGGDAPTDLNGNTIKTPMDGGYILPAFRLPTEAEWEYAALGIHSVPEEENAAESRMYPWDGKDTRDFQHKKTKGDFQANFTRGRGDLMGMGGSLNDRALIPADVRSFMPNDFGLYNMAGNVNEWVLDVYRPLSSTDVEEYNPFRGNEYVSPIYEQRTISTGETVRVPQIDSLGRVVRAMTLTEGDDPAQRMAELSKQDVRNFLDGDPQSIANRNEWRSTMDPDTATNLMYNADGTEAIGLLNSHITNTSRVYKGGSWRDRPYWLNPSTRRWQDQKLGSNDIGFRCAMTRVGASTRK